MKPYLILIFALSCMLAGCSHTKVILPSQKESTARQELERFVRQLVDDFNGGDPVVLKRNHHIPFARVMSPEVEWWDDPARLLVDYTKLRATGWDRSVVNKIEIIYAAPKKGITRLNFSRMTKDGKVLLTTDAFYFVTKINGKWGIAAMFIGADNLPLD